MIYLVLKLNFLVSVFLYNKKNPQVTFLWLKNFRPSPFLLLLPLFSTFVDNINAYLIEAPDIFIENRKKTISSVSNVVFGSMPNDGGILSDYSFENKEEIVKKYPLARSMFKPFIGAKEFLHNKERYCLWLKDISPNEVKKVPPVMDAVLKVKLLRENSNREATKKLAEYPMLFGEVRQPEDTYIIIPRHSSQNRRYIPLGFMSPDVICGDSNLLMSNATLYDFGIMTELSCKHMGLM